MRGYHPPFPLKPSGCPKTQALLKQCIIAGSMYSGNFWTDFSLNNVWISYNLGLALIPFVLAQVLFNKKRNFSFLWIVGFILFILFLPNAPYVFTDLIHLPKALFAFNSKKAEFVITGQFFVLISFGFYFFNESYRKFENFIINMRLF